MTVGSLPEAELKRRLDESGLTLSIGPFVARVRSRLPDVRRSIRLLYQDFPVAREAGAHFTVGVVAPVGVRRYVRPQVLFWLEGRTPFTPLPRRMAAALVEWGLNYCIGMRSHQYLVIHAAVVERYGRALLIPSPPGAGKSTLCAALAHRGWRLVSDEFALMDPESGFVVPVPRPVALKNESIDLIRRWAPGVEFAPEVLNNVGLRVAYMRPPAESVRRASERVPPGWVVVPSFGGHVTAPVEPLSRARTLMHLADNSFNYNVRGTAGFELLAGIASRAPGFRIRYSDTLGGVAAIESVCAGAEAPR